MDCVFDDDIIEIKIQIGDITISSVNNYISEISGTSISFEAHNGVESGIEVNIQDDSTVTIEITGDWGDVKINKDLSAGEMTTLRNKLYEIMQIREDLENRENENDLEKYPCND